MRLFSKSEFVCDLSVAHRAAFSGSVLSISKSAGEMGGFFLFFGRKRLPAAYVVARGVAGVDRVHTAFFGLVQSPKLFYPVGDGRLGGWSSVLFP